MSTPETGPLQSGSSASTIPILGEGFQETPNRHGTANSDNESEAADKNAKSAKQRLFALMKKMRKEEKKQDGRAQKRPESQQNATGTESTKAPVSSSNVSSSHSSPRVRATTHPYRYATSPNRGFSRLTSPAGSQIFERDVQESPIPAPNSPAIPSHIQNENRIPPVLDQASEAITNSHLDPDCVEIVTHSSHHPAAAMVTGLGNSEIAGSLFSDDSTAHPDKEEVASNYGNLDSTDVKRISFISFADLVQSEQAEHSAGTRDSAYLAGLTSLVDRVNRSPSPVRSPVSSTGFGTSPPTSGSSSPKATETSPSRIGRSIGNPSLNYPSPPGELTIETMSHAMQALKKVGSADVTMTGARTPQPLSPVSSTDGMPR